VFDFALPIFMIDVLHISRILASYRSAFGFLFNDAPVIGTAVCWME